MKASTSYNLPGLTPSARLASLALFVGLTGLFWSGYFNDASSQQALDTAAPEKNTETAPESSPAAEDAEYLQSEEEEISPDEAALPVNQPLQLPDPVGAERLSRTDRAWFDSKRGRVIVDGRVSLRRGVLEMFACPLNTKEHESIVAVESRAFVIHAALLAAGAEPGTPVQWDPKYVPPTGTEILIEVLWLDKNGKRQKAKAQDWITDIRKKKPMNLPWVFAGSGFVQDEETGRKVYLAEVGDLICVSNFSSAMLDIPAESTNADEGLYFEANTKAIPPLGCPVRLVMTPKLKKDDDKEEPKNGDAVTEGSKNATPGNETDSSGDGAKKTTLQLKPNTRN